MSAYVVGLTGGLASGKSTVAHLFAACGVTVVDADAVVAELTAAGGVALPLLQQAVGDWVLTDKGEYNRPLVRQKIFTQPVLRAQIEAVLHPLATEILQQRLAAATSAYAVGVIPLLFESDSWVDYFHQVVVVDCDYSLQLQRANARDGKQDAADIIAVQLSAAERRQRADIVIENNEELPVLFNAVYALHQKLSHLTCS
ncbi:MAG: dephospho-CoA kinase [Proteobacteria bacterium]|nr:dephospho-CoA kinase [Pseudomonadota bacterium]